MLFKHVSNMLRIEVAFLVKPALGQSVCDKLRQTTLPWPEWSGKTALPSFQDFRG